MDEDRQLLEAAAKAAGIEVAYMDDLGVVPTGTREDGPRRGTWNPLTDDGDALRLAVKLMIDVGRGSPLTGFWRDGTQACALSGGTMYCEDFDSDPYAATRRAIVRAAADIAARGAGKESAG